MALSVNVSNSLEALSTAFAADLKASTNNVFQPYRIVSQTQGMNNWLIQHLAQELGILANAEFLQPNDIFTSLYKSLGGRGKRRLDTETLRWNIFSALNDPAFIQQFPEIADYYHNDARKRMALAEKTADLFDQYQVYRPEMIRSWNQSQLCTTFSDEKWQQYLWSTIKSKLQSAYFDKLGYFDYIQNALLDPNSIQLIQERLPDIYFFGISIISPFHVSFFQLIAAHTNVHFYILNPAPETYWMDDVTEKQIARSKSRGKNYFEGAPIGNTLLLNFGKVIKDTFRLFFQNEQFLNHYTEVGLQPPHNGTLLGKLQADIYSNADKTTRNAITEDNLNDQSIAIQSCFTPIREVETVYNYLVKMVDSGELTTVRDCVVMVTDIDAYAPYIKAIFENAPYRFPFSIADNSVAQGDTLYSALVSLFEFDTNMFKAESVVQLLDSGYITKRFNISNTQLIRQAISDANIRFGIEGRQEDDTYLVSFQYGLKRLLYGMCVALPDAHDHINFHQEAIYPVEIAEGAAGLDLIRFIHFVEVLIAFSEERLKNKTLANWLNYTEALVENMIADPNQAVEEELELLSKTLEHLNNSTQHSSEEVSFDVFRQVLLPYIASEQRNNNFVSGGITFCSLIPMRSVPFKIICVLGLNFDKFPRRDNALGFDLMQKKPQLGDRNVKDNDKHLFLETILSAHKYLYLSYIGQNSKDNTTLPASSLIDELINYIEEKAPATISRQRVRDYLITNHPLHSFSFRYNNKEFPRLYSYLSFNESKSGSSSEKSTSEQSLVLLSDEVESITVPNFTLFFENSFKQFLNQQLGIYYRDEEFLLSDNETFEPDQLQVYAIKNYLLQNNDTKAKDELRGMLMRNGTLPLKNAGVISLQKIENELKEVKVLYQDVTQKAHSRKLILQIDSSIFPQLQNRSIVGEIPEVYFSTIVVVCLTDQKSNPNYTINAEYKYLLKTWLYYLLARSAGEEVQAVFISKAHNQVYPVASMSIMAARQELTAFIQSYLLGRTTLNPFSVNLVTPEQLEQQPLPELEIIQEEILEKFTLEFNGIYDDYLNKMYELDYFSNRSAIELLISNATQVHSSLKKGFPTYEFSLASKV